MSFISVIYKPLFKYIGLSHAFVEPEITQDYFVPPDRAGVGSKHHIRKVFLLTYQLSFYSPGLKSVFHFKPLVHGNRLVDRCELHPRVDGINHIKEDGGT